MFAALLFAAAASAPVVLAPTHYDLAVHIEPASECCTGRPASNCRTLALYKR